MSTLAKTTLAVLPSDLMNHSIYLYASPPIRMTMPRRRESNTLLLSLTIPIRQENRKEDHRNHHLTINNTQNLLIFKLNKQKWGRPNIAMICNRG
jgi:hypothetical protein